MEENKELNEVVDQTETVEAEPVITKESTVLLNVDYKTLTYYNMFYMKHIKKFFLVYIVMIVLAIGFGVFNYIRTKQAAISIVMGVFALYMVYSMLTFSKNINRQLTQHFNNSRPAKQTYHFTNVGFSVQTEGKEKIDYDWSLVSKIYVTPMYYYLYLGKTPLIIDRNPEMIVSGSQEEVDAIIEEVAKTKPIKRLKEDAVKNFVDFNYPDYDAMEQARAEQLEAIKAEEEARKAQEEAKDAVVEEHVETVDVDSVSKEESDNK